MNTAAIAANGVVGNIVIEGVDGKVAALGVFIYVTINIVAQQSSG